MWLFDGEVVAYWLVSWIRNRKVASSYLGSAGIVGGGSECTALSLHPQFHDWGAL